MTKKAQKRNGPVIQTINSKKQKLQPSKSRNRRKPRNFIVQTRQENLTSIYGFTSTLQEFLDTINAFNAAGLTGAITCELKDFLSSTLVGIEDINDVHKFLSSHFASYLVESNPSQGELIKLVIEDQFKRARQVDHVLAFGFEVTHDSLNFGSNIEMISFNSQVEALQSEFWLELRSVTSVAVIYYLFSVAALFQPLPNNNLLQITGRSIDATSKALSASLEKTNKNIAKLKGDKSSCLAMNRANKVSMKKVSVIYANPFFFSSERKVRNGLWPQHHLNTSLPCLKSCVNEEVKLNSRVKCVLMFMFPVQHRLPSPLTSEPDKGSAGRPLLGQFNLYKAGVLERDFLKSRVPKRLNGRPFELVKQLISNNGKCPYTALLNRFCPNKHERASTLISEKLLSQRPDQWGDQTTVLIRQFDETPSDVNLTGISSGPEIPDRSFISSQWEELKKVDLSSDYKEVFQFCQSVIKRVIPKELIGSPSNWAHFLDCVGKFIRISRYEDLRLSYIAEGMKIPEIWTNNGAWGQSNFYKCRELHLEFLNWVFDQFLTPVLRAHFYATEVSGKGNRIVYYRHDVWCSLTSPAFEEFSSTSLEPIPRRKARELIMTSKIGPPSSLRFIPKVGGGYRGIVCLGRSREKTIHDPIWNRARVVPLPSVNRILKDLFTTLSFEHWNSGEAAIGGALISTTQLHDRLLKFKQNISTPLLGNSLPKLYFVKVDIKKCYDTIPAKVAFQLAEKLLKNDFHETFKSYFLHKFQKLSCKASGSTPRSAYKLLPEYATSSTTAAEKVKPLSGKFNKPSSMLAMDSNTKVFIDRVGGYFREGEYLKNLLKEHLTQNLIRVGRTVYRQDVGIPQGSVLSTLLCNIVYAQLEKQLLLDTKRNLPPYLLVRFVDDFLFISPNRSLSELFLTRMSEGFPEFGAHIHEEKTLTNFKPRKFNYEFNNGKANYRKVTTLNSQDKNELLSPVIMPYIGIGINTETLEITKLPTSSGSEQTSNADSITVRAHGAPRALIMFKSSIFRVAKMRLSLSMIDLKLNSWPTILENIRVVANEIGNRIVLGTSLWLRKTAKHSSRVIMATLGQVIILIVERTRYPNHKKFEDAWEQDIINIAARAIIKVFKQRKRHKLAPCIDYLETLISEQTN